MAGHGVAVELDAAQTLGRTLGLLLQQGLLADEVVLVKLHEHAQAGHHRGDLVAQLVAVEGQAHLEAQRVAATEAAGLHAGLDQLVPAAADVLVGTVELETVLARIARAGDDDGLAVLLQRLHLVELQVAAGNLQHLLDRGLGLGTLDGELAVVVALVAQHDVEAFGLLLEPLHVLVDVGGVDREDVVVLLQLADAGVIDHATVLVAEHAVDHLARSHRADVVGENVVDVLLGLGTGDAHLAHVAHVEHTDVLANGIVLVNNATILDRHVKTAERGHQGSQSHMLIMKTSLFHHYILSLII